MFDILRNVGNMFLQLDLIELLVRYFYKLKNNYNLKSVMDYGSDSISNADGQMLCHFFNTMKGDNMVNIIHVLCIA